MKAIVIGTRGSKLALWQAHWVRDALSARHPDREFAIAVVKTAGDARHDLSPDAFGEEGIFTAELDRRLLAGEIDLAVHSLKDLPTSLAPGLCLAAVTERETVADLLILRSDVAASLGIRGDHIPESALADADRKITVGTSSQRRIVLLGERFPKLLFTPMRGNLDTRLRKLEERQVDALVVAEAGLVRLGIAVDRHAVLRLLPERYLPAAGQGALGIESRAEGEAMAIALEIDHPETRVTVTAERSAMSALGAGCRVPAGFFGKLDGPLLTLWGVVGSPNRPEMVRAEAAGASNAPEALGLALAESLLAKGASAILKEVRR